VRKSLVMEDLRIGRVIRALRLRVGWTQADVGRKASVSQQLVSDVERGRVASVTVATLRAVAAAVGATIGLEPRWRGPSLDQLLDLDHSALAQRVMRQLELLGWLVQVEVTFSRYGERGSIDLLAYHPFSGSLLVIEVKTILPDLQAMLRTLDMKVRLAAAEAARFGWRPVSVVPCIVLADGTTNRRRLAQFSGLLARFAVRGRDLRAWLQAPTPLSPGVGLLLLGKVPSTPGDGTRRAGRQRMRKTASAPSVGSVNEPPLEVPIRA
jgi:transcriptional regulator with XRE-family HTH domain